MTAKAGASWLRKDVEARTVSGDAVFGRGRVVAFVDRPTFIIEREDGSRFSWIADLCQLATSDPEIGGLE